MTACANCTAPVVRGRTGEPHGPFFEALSMEHVKQVGPSCVATTLSMVANATGAHLARGLQGRDQFSGTAHLVGGAEALRTATGLLYNDVRRLAYFVDELVAYDDLFFLCFYSEDPPSDPQPSGSCHRPSSLCTATRSTRPSGLHRAVCANCRTTAGSRGRPREFSGSCRFITRGVSDEHGRSRRNTSRMGWLHRLRPTVCLWPSRRRPSGQADGHRPSCNGGSSPRQFWSGGRRRTSFHPRAR